MTRAALVSSRATGRCGATAAVREPTSMNPRQPNSRLYVGHRSLDGTALEEFSAQVASPPGLCASLGQFAR